MTSFIHTIITWFELLSLAFCVALLIFRLPVFSSSLRFGHAHELLIPGMARLIAIAVAAIALCSIGDMLLRTAEMSGRQIEDVLPLLSTVLLHSHYGIVWLIRIAALVTLLIFIPLTKIRPDLHSLRFLMLGFGIIIIWTESAAGHASDQGDFTIREMMDMFHLLAASAWGGGVFVLSFIVLPSMMRRRDIISIVEVSRKFSRMAGFAVAAILITALYNARTYVGSFDAIWKTSYGLTVFAKAILFYFLILLGGFNRYVNVPLLEHAAGTRVEGPGALGLIVARLFEHLRHYLSAHIGSLFGKMLIIEAMLVIAVFLCVGMLKHETPPSHLKHMKQEQMERGPTKHEAH